MAAFQIHECAIAIIGAGVAGLAAANTLLGSNFEDFVLIEARNRLGGRVVAINIEGRQLELGANWIHGVLGNPIYEIASVNGLVPIIQTSKPHSVVAAKEDGTKVSFAVLQEMYDVYSVFFKRCEEYFLCSYSPPENIHSVGDHLLLERDIYLSKYPESQQTNKKLVFNHLMNREACISGADLSEVDLIEIGSYTELPGGNINMPAGFSGILKPLTRNIPPDKIFKGHQVDVIRWSSMDKLEGKRIEIVCENGVKFLVKSVICSVPLGVLKTKHQTMFDPPLPTYKVNSLEKLSFGIVDKIYLEYDRPFLCPEMKELVLLWDEEPLSQDINDRWYRKIYSFTKLEDTLLLAWISGEEAKYMESIPFETVGEKCTEILRKFLNDPCVPEPKRCICTSWWSQPYSRGSYTSIGIGGTQNDIANLANPVYSDCDDKVPRLLFAGEHCHPSFYSTVHGAYLSGRDSAKYLSSLPCIKTSQTKVVGPGKSSEKANEPVTYTVEGTADLSSWLKGLSFD